ncbi:hypothetical protein VTO42DRAFT_402 [Malbranchea cinnamomea]
MHCLVMLVPIKNQDRTNDTLVRTLTRQVAHVFRYQGGEGCSTSHHLACPAHTWATSQRKDCRSRDRHEPFDSTTLNLKRRKAEKAKLSSSRRRPESYDSTRGKEVLKRRLRRSSWTGTWACGKDPAVSKRGLGRNTYPKLQRSVPTRRQASAWFTTKVRYSVKYSPSI